ncbi:nucleotidyl transferase AbiEii/AbiGii toxin family protein [bacterium]|nr:nucleotidyl transferase AbiEii/AbiGii toxin family protein [bacterium]
MHSAIESMLKNYQAKTPDEHKNALKEIIQQIALLGLFRNRFFEKAAFYGGTALRVFYGLPRFSEDLDFSLLKKDHQFDISPYCAVIQEEMAAYGFDVEVKKKEKTADTAIESAFIKGNTKIHLLKIAAIRPPVAGIDENESLKIKLEVDTDPPPGAEYEMKYLLMPIPFSVRVFTQSSLFAGKLHALLCRNWKGDRVKGRDLFDYIWYLSRDVSINLEHLQQRMVQTGHWKSQDQITQEDLTALLENKFQALHYEQAKKDVLPFVGNPDELQLWSADFFNAITRDKLRVQ